MNAIPLIAALLIGQITSDSDSAAAAAIAIANAKRPQPKVQAETLTEALARAAKHDTPYLVVFAGVEVRKFTDVLSYKSESGVVGQPAKCIVVVKASGEHVATLAPTATAAEIGRAIYGTREVSRPASFFRGRLRRGEVERPADGEEVEPQLRRLLRGMERYDSAKNTQITFRRETGYISPFARTRLENKWQVPGHLDGVQGWSSVLYRRPGKRAHEYLVRQDPNDGLSAVTWWRSYPDGAEFIDVLRNRDGHVFEARVAEKRDGKWERYVAFRDPDKRPEGYSKPSTAECRACHSQAGIAAYGGAAVPGADTIISDPISIIERGQTIQDGFGTRWP